MRLVVIVFVACGAPPPPPAPSPPAPARVAGPPAPVTCADVGVILRGDVEDEREAGPMKEAAIARACLHDKWPREVIDCVGSSVHPKPCIEKLADEQRAAYAKKLLAWVDAYPDEQLDLEAPPEPEEIDVACADGVGDVAQYAPAITSSRRALAVALRKQRVLELCEGWEMVVRACFQTGKPPAMCRRLLDPDQEQELADKLAEIDALVAKAAKAPPCSALKAKKRCVDEKWSEDLRACLGAGGGDACFDATGVTP